jgi:hypothetical protein
MALRKKTRTDDETAPQGSGCGVSNCGKPVTRHLAVGKVSAALPSEKVKAAGHSVGLCKDHYHAFKKATKADREIERAGW